MLTQYKNNADLLLSNRGTTALRFDKSQLDLMIATPAEYQAITNLSQTKIELHIYAEDVWITGNHDTIYTTNSSISDSFGNTIPYKSSPIGINLQNELQKLKITSGNFNFIVNFFEPLIGSFDEQHLYIDQISPDRTEIRLRAVNPTDSRLKTQITKYIRTVNHTRTKTRARNNKSVTQYHETYLLNFSRNKCFKFINSVILGEYVYIKLQDPLPTEYDKNLKCWIVKEIRNPYFDRVVLSKADVTKTFSTLSGPNFFANANNTLSTETDFKAWTDLLGTSVQTSQQIVDTYFSGSLSGMQLGIDFTDFNNFIFYSSATERVKNFRFKLELLEYYAQQSASINLISGSTATTNAMDFESQRTNLISGFDAFEKFLYFESSSKLTTHSIPVEFPSVYQLTGSYITPVPKTNKTKPYPLASVNSIQFTNWYNGLIDSASFYDKLNNNSLVRSIPEFIRLDKSNENLDLFVNMLGHHYDILYMYINSMTKINSREENPKLGMPNDLLFSVAKQFGWTLTDGNQYQDLWQYVYGSGDLDNYGTGGDQYGIATYGNDIYGTSTLVVSGSAMSGKDMTYTVWRRIVNNLPLLLKSKGTKRSVQALLSCYGIPQSLITIQEYGGPRIDRAPIYKKLNFDYALDLINNPTGTVQIDYNQSLNLNTVEVRFRTDNVVTNPSIPSTMNLFTVGNNTVTIDYTRGTLGTIQINGTGSSDIEMFDGGWLTVMLRAVGSTLQVVAKRSKYGKIVAAVSASTSGSFSFNNVGLFGSGIYGTSIYGEYATINGTPTLIVPSGSIILGGNTGGARLQGQLQEFRIWNSSLSDSAFNNHVKAPAAYNGNISAYDELLFRLPLTQKINHNDITSLPGVQPVYSQLSASFTNWTTAEPYDSIEETYYYDGISLGTGTYDDNKVRLESNELIGPLSLTHRSELSAYDEAPLDTNKLGIFFSPQTIINDDIIAQLGFTSLDDYIGDPSDVSKYEYPALRQKAFEYWQKYTDKNDFNEYIKIFTLFDMSFFQQLNQLLPARVNKMTGILIQPNLLERNRYNNLPDLSYTDNTYAFKLNGLHRTIEASSYMISGAVNKPIKIITGSMNIITGSLNSLMVNISSSFVNTTVYNGSTQILVNFDNNSIQKTYSGSLYMLPEIQTEYNSSFNVSLTTLIDPESGAAYNRKYLLWNGSEYIEGTTPNWLSDGVLTPIDKSVYSEFSLKSGSISYSTATYTFTGSRSNKQDFLPRGKENSIYNGSKITSRDFNINSTDTIDGGPVVEWSVSNGTQLIYTTPSTTGVFKFNRTDNDSLNLKNILRSYRDDDPNIRTM